MNQKKIIKVLGTATVFAALGLVACGDDSSSSPVIPNEILSSESSEPASTESALPASSESALPASSGNAQPASSENANPASSGSNPASSGSNPTSSNSNPASSNSNPASSGAVAGSSSSAVNGSSSSQVGSSSAVNPNSSSSKENCLHMPHFADSLHITYQIPVCTAEEEGTRLPDCETSDVYVCENGSWNTVADETCRHITDTGDPMKPHPCTVEFDVAMDCVKNYYMMCANGIWLNATGCDTTKEKCGFDDYKLCMDYQLRAYCSDDWLNEPCEEGRSRDLRIYDTTDSTSFSYVNYVCVEGKWVKRSSLYSNCDNDKDCLGGFQQCWQSDIIGQPCDEKNPETAWITEGRCDYVCNDGKYEFVPPPTK